MREKIVKTFGYHMIFSETVGKKTQISSPVYVHKVPFLVSYFRFLKYYFKNQLFYWFDDFFKLALHMFEFRIVF